MEKAKTIWNKATKELKKEFPRNNFNIWIKPTVGANLTEEKLVIGVPNGFIKKTLETRYYQSIKRTVDEITDQDLKVEFIVSEKAAVTFKSKKASPLFSDDQHPSDQNKPTQRSTIKSLNPRYSFETFIAGNSNNFAHAAAKAVVESPGTTYNPLFIYGGTGVGKTHLLHAIGHALIEHKGLDVQSISTEQFTSEIVTSLNQGNIQRFRKKVRGTDALLIDDVQFISGKDFSQEEFFNTFNKLHLSNKQIVICSDRPPREIPKLESRLVSRFLGGLTVDIQPPDYEMRVAIINVKADDMGVELEDGAVDLLASTLQTNTRELEGILFSILTATQLEKKKPTVEFIRQRLGQTAATNHRIPKPKEVLSLVAKHYDLKIKELSGKSRKADIVRPRQIAMYLLREHLNQSYESVGELLGGRDHTTVMYGVEKIEKLKQDEPDIDKEISGLKDQMAQPI